MLKIVVSGEIDLSRVQQFLHDKFSRLINKAAADDIDFLAALKMCREMTLRIVSDVLEEQREGESQDVLFCPVSKLDISVRVRKSFALEGIETLGQLIRKTPEELLGMRYVGETVLQELQEKLGKLGLKLNTAPTSSTSEKDTFLSWPVSELGLSSRSEKCMRRLEINTVGQLVRRTGRELLACKNFAITSLNEVRQKLHCLGLRLRGD